MTRFFELGQGYELHRVNVILVDFRTFATRGGDKLYDDYIAEIRKEGLIK